MNQHIKIIWILSLVSVLMLIGMQGYWLINQYEYVLNTYSGEIALQVLQAGEEEFLSRKNTRSLISTYMMRTNNDSSAYKRLVVFNAMTTHQQSLENDPMRPLQFAEIRSTQPPAQYTGDRVRIGLNADSAIDTTQIIASFYTNLTGDELQKASEKTLTHMVTPFDSLKFISILSSLLPDLKYQITPWQPNDVFDGSGLWTRTGNPMNPVLSVAYAYNPLENQGIYIDVVLPTQPVFYRMGIQLIVSIVLTFLLIACLIFQVRTIMKQRKVNEIRENFVHTMVHELKRPVQTLKTFVSFLKDRKMRSDVEATEQVVRDSMFELDNLTAYLNKLKDMLQADSETTSLHPVQFNLQDLVEKVIRLTHIPPGKEVTITPVYEVENLMMHADPIHIANVLSNLVENAIKYSGDKVYIEIQTGQDKRTVWVAVKDDGIGIPVSEQEIIFTKFFRGSNIPDKTIPGIGLGLSYVKLIVEAHQGKIQLNSRAGAGTALTIYLPQP
ncbi:MAG: HAMP domain-containing histidine kinase [Tannerella sp.]|jgi:two-component system phosphate regulon sensor histidine kinase PhoR|nr:HAMP domain-containing histidine kinase [Tannerella sp.]